MKRFTVGDRAPDIKTRDVKGKKVTFSSFDTPYVLVAFLRYSGCPYCNLSVHRFAMEHSLLRESGCSVLAFVQSDKKTIEENIYDRHSKQPDYSIVADKEMNFYKKFGVTPSYKNTAALIKDIPHWLHAVREHGFTQKQIDGNFLIAPAIFLVNKHSREILLAEYVSDLFKHETFSPIYDKILTFQ